MKILQLSTGAHPVGANWTGLADAIIARLKTKHPAAAVMLRDFAKTSHPPLDEFAMTALGEEAASNGFGVKR